MNPLTHFQLLAQYNTRLNNQVYAAANTLTEADFNKPMGAFFSSVQGTLNHIMVGDLIWLRRFNQHRDYYSALSTLNNFPVPAKLNDIIYTDRHTLDQARKTLDIIITTWIDKELLLDDLAASFTYHNMQGVAGQKNFAEVLSHFFNHQTHHRGQASTLLFQLGCDVGVTDFLIDIPNT